MNIVTDKMVARYSFCGWKSFWFQSAAFSGTFYNFTNFKKRWRNNPLPQDQPRHAFWQPDSKHAMRLPKFPHLTRLPLALEITLAVLFKIAILAIMWKIFFSAPQTKKMTMPTPQVEQHLLAAATASNSQPDSSLSSKAPDAPAR